MRKEDAREIERKSRITEDRMPSYSRIVRHLLARVENATKVLKCERSKAIQEVLVTWYGEAKYQPFWETELKGSGNGDIWDAVLVTLPKAAKRGRKTNLERLSRQAQNDTELNQETDTVL
jgi:hypothetical protein